VTEFVQLLANPINLFLTGLLAICLLYWLLVIIGGIGVDSLDFDFDVDVDLDIDADVDSELNVSGGSGFLSMLQFFNFGRLPMMLIFSVLFLFMWAIAIFSSNILPGNSALISAVLLIPNFIVSLFFTKFMTLPIVKPYHEMTKTAEAIDYIGKQCTITLPNTDNKAGEAELFVNEISLNITVKGLDNQVFSKGEKTIIVDEIKEKKIFIIDKINV